MKIVRGMILGFFLAGCDLDEVKVSSSAAAPPTLTLVETASLSLPFNSSTKADFNGDGRVDLAASRSTIDPTGPSAAVDIFLSDSSNQYPALPDSTIPLDPASADVVAADFDGDGRIDLAVAVFTDLTGGRVELYLGQGDGTFQSPVTACSGIDAFKLGAGDFDGDGSADLVLSSGLETRVYPNLGAGTFGAPAALPFPSLFAVSDVDSNGRSELAVIEWAWDTKVNVYDDLLGAPVVAATLTLPADQVATCVIAAGLGGTGGSDIAIGTLDMVTGLSGGFRVYRTNLLGFDPPVDVATLAVMKLVAADYNGDGRADLVLYREGGVTELTVAIGQPDGSYTLVSWALSSDPALQLLSVPLSGSAFTGILVVSSTQSFILRGSTDTSLQPAW